MNGGPTVDVALRDAEPVAGLVDEAADVDGRRHHLLAVLGAVLLDVAPGRLHGPLDALLELLGRVDLGVVDPLLVLQLLVRGLEQVLAEVEGLHLLGREAAREDVEVLSASVGGYMSESMLARNRLLFRCSSLASSSLAPRRLPVKK